MKERILDLGIGKGGEYLLKDRLETSRIGVDKNFDDLARFFPENYKNKTALLLVADAESNLPFADGIFDKVQILFPNGELLLGLCSSDFSLWAELNRILKEDGSVDVYIDVPFTKTRRVTVHGRVETITRPLSGILSTCKNFGFRATYTRLSSEVTQKLGTEGSRFAVEFRTSVFHISAQKE